MWHRCAALQVNGNMWRVETFRDIIQRKFKPHFGGITTIFDTIPIPEIIFLKPFVFIITIDEFEVICQVILFKIHLRSESRNLRRCRVRRTGGNLWYPCWDATIVINCEPIDVPTAIRISRLMSKKKYCVLRIKTSILCAADVDRDPSVSLRYMKSSWICTDEFYPPVTCQGFCCQNIDTCFFDKQFIPCDIADVGRE